MADNLVDFSHNSRTYVRTGNWHITAQSSSDDKEWTDITVPNISANGLLFLSDKPYTPGDTVQLKLVIDPLLVTPSLTYQITASAIVKSIRGEQDGMQLIAVQFKKISQSDQIQLDELVRMTVSKYGND